MIIRKPVSTSLLALLLTCAIVLSSQAQQWRPTIHSLRHHETPEWFRDAKVGIFIHWGVYSVPAWERRGQYAEWYPYRMQQEGSPVHKYHVETYGEDFSYEDFIPMWKAENWDPVRWAELFERAGARYVVPVGEHHDGFPLWDSELTEWNAANMGPKRDLIGELGVAVRRLGMKYAPSYHGLLNYYEPGHQGPHPDYFSEAYVEFIHAKIRELIDKYQPDLLWLDGDWTRPLEDYRIPEIVAYYYNKEAEWGKQVAVNDRWGQVRGILGDFFTQEYDYDTIDRLIDHKWENTRGMAGSFGYNQNELPEDYLSVTEVVHMLVDNVSKNANLLLNVGPEADGTIPEIQKQILLGMGGWLDENGEGIYASRPWVTASGRASGDLPVRFTWKQKEDAVYAFLLHEDNDERMQHGEITLYNVMPVNGTEIRALGGYELVNWRKEGNNVVVELPDHWPAEHASTLRISPEPGYFYRHSDR